MENKELPSVPSKPHRVIQPVSDMSDYTPKEPAEPAKAAKPVDRPAPENQHERPIYPDAKRDAQTEPSHPTPHANETKSYLSNDAAAARVPLLRIYAIVNIVYALYLAYRLLTAAGGLDTVSVQQSLLLGSAAFHLIIGVYLLTARDLRVVSGLLLGLIITDGLAVLSLIVSFTRVPGLMHLEVLRPFFISLGLLIFTWFTRSRVDLASVED
jgi:hypothetical protein